MIESVVQQRILEFHQRHGGECYPLSGFYWYKTGGYRDMEPLGILMEPPDSTTDQGQFKLLQNKLNFYKAALKHVVNQFESLRESLLFMRPTDEDAAIKKLEELRQRVEVRQEELRQAQQTLDQSRIGKMRTGQREFQAEETLKMSRWQARLKPLRI